MSSPAQVQRLIALDISGSTGGVAKYWNYVKPIVEDPINRDAVFYLWDDRCDRASYDQVMMHVRNRT